MRIIVTGSGGLVGSALTPALESAGHSVLRMVRSSAAIGRGIAPWDPEAGRLDPAHFSGVDAVVHLAGENIAAGRWTAAKKERIRESRTKPTRLLAETLAGLSAPPRVLVSASAIGIYGDRGDQALSEESPAGSGFLPEVCREWEAATQPAAAKDIRVVNLRIGVVLSPKGGALAKMLTPFRMGVGGKLGGGNQYMSWISLDDLVGVIQHVLTDESLSGAVNAVAPQAVTNYEFTKTLGRALGRPTIFPMPGFAARLAFGEMADALLLASARVEPAKLRAAGYSFRHPHLEVALRALLAK